MVCLIAVLGAMAFAHAAPVKPLYFRALDASAAVPLDAEHFAAASDEENIIRVYRRVDSSPVQEVDLSAALEVDAKSPESDIEAAAKVGNIVYWITSHGRNKDGKYRASRNRFFATEIVREGTGFRISVVGKPYKDLLQDLLVHEPLKPFGLNDAARRAPKSPGGLNIEALAEAQDGTLLVGFRSPLEGGLALMVPLLNPEAMVRGERARLGTPRQLNLNGLGFRSMERRGNEYVIVAGSTDGNSRFELFAWPGGEESPRLLQGALPAALNPESLITYGSLPTGFHLLSDDSGEPHNQGAGKKRSTVQKSFRSGWVAR